MPYGPNQFQLTVIKPYHKDNSFKPLQDVPEDIPDDVLEDVPENVLEDIPEDILENVLKDILKNVLKENYDQHAPEGDYNSDTIVVDILQL